MAELVVSSVLEKLDEYLLRDALPPLHGVREELQRLGMELRAILPFLKDADCTRMYTSTMRVWLSDVIDLAYDVEDVQGTLMLHGYTSALTSIRPLRKIRKQIKEIKDRIKRISDLVRRYGLFDLAESGFLDEVRIPTSSYFCDQDTIVGREKDKEMILKQLFHGNKQLCVISIVGMAGLGKTTLAQIVYNSVEVVQEFRVRAWVLASQNYRLTQLLKTIIEFVAPEEDTQDMEEEALQGRVYELLQNNGRYLLVMDDVWTMKVWEKIRTALPDMENGSRVIFTSRRIDVAKLADPAMDPYELRLLDTNKSRRLFLELVFPDEDVQTFPENLKDIGERLLSKCHGLPLALRSLGSLLRTKERIPSVWSRVLISVDEEILGGPKHIPRMSYEDLPDRLKQCFLYTASFPQDSEINTVRLIRLWIAEDFIPERAEETREQTARGFLDELVQRCMVQVAYRRYDGVIWSIRIHPFYRNLCLDEARGIGFLMVENTNDDASTSSDVKSARRWAFYNHNPFEEQTGSSIKHMRCEKLLTLLTFDLRGEYNVISKTIGQALGGLKLLRVVDIEIDTDEDLEKIMLPKEITTMIHLRYLRWTITSSYFSGSMYLHSVQNLRLLQTLLVSGLNIGSNSGLGNLTDLQELRAIQSGAWIESDLPKLTNLQKLEIIDITPSHEKTLTKSLGKFKHLEYLMLGLESISVEFLAALSSLHTVRVLSLHGKVSTLGHSGFSTSLTELILMQTKLEKDPMPVLEKLPNLVHLCLTNRAYVGKCMSCSAGGFPRLLSMELQFLLELEDWRVEAGAMPCLTHLTINACWMLEVLPEGLRQLTTLQELVLSREFTERVRENEGEDWHKVRHVPSINIIH